MTPGKTDIYKKAGINIRMFRKKEKLNLEELAKKSGISTSFLSNIEKGSRKPTLETIEKIANALGIGTATVFSDKLSLTYLPEENTVTLEIMKLISSKNLTEKKRILSILKHL